MENQKEEIKLKNAVTEKVISYVVAAFSLVAGLAWNEAIKSFIEYFFPAAGKTMIAKFSYALLLTIVLVFVTVYLGKFFREKRADKG